MKITRRGFIKLTGASALGLGLLPVSNVLAGKDSNPTVDGKRWAMVIDSRKCTDSCEACILACHKAHNVPKIDCKKDEVKWIWKEDYEHAFPSQKHDYLQKNLQELPFMMLCNHCDNPPCVRVCPTQATFQREDGIVMMDYHRCIGCRYCMAGCPYGARSFNFTDPRAFIEDYNSSYPTRAKGVVEKCEFCVERLAKGLQPACVEACACGALTFGDLNDPGSKVRKLLFDNHTIVRKPDLGTKPCVYYIV